VSLDRWVLALIMALPPIAGLVCLRLASRNTPLAWWFSTVTALALALLASLTVGASIPLPANRALELTAVAQFGVEVLALAMLALLLSLHRDASPVVARWLPVAWFSLSGLVAALLVNSLPVAVLCFLVAALVWVFGVPAADRSRSRSPMLRYMALLVLTMPLLVGGFGVASGMGMAAVGVEALVLAFLAPGFGLVLGLIPLHGWTLTLAGGAPRAMLFGILALVQTTGYLLVIRTLESLPWLVSGAHDVLIFGGALSMLAGGWLALAAPLDDRDDWLVYAAIAGGGAVLVGLGSHTLPSAVGALFVILARVLALVLLALAPRVGELRLARLALAVGTVTLAGTPGLAGFPGLWLALQPLRAMQPAQLAMLAGSALLFATAVRRRGVTATPEAGDAAGDGAGPRRAVWLLMGILLTIGLVPGLIVPALGDVLRDLYLP
jgi:formate hydrogenlyase subunit 3/multisubunit Na+/H+ antiporter MnhD subunit